MELIEKMEPKSTPPDSGGSSGYHSSGTDTSLEIKANEMVAFLAGNVPEKRLDGLIMPHIITGQPKKESISTGPKSLDIRHLPSHQNKSYDSAKDNKTKINAATNTKTPSKLYDNKSVHSNHKSVTSNPKSCESKSVTKAHDTRIDTSYRANLVSKPISKSYDSKLDTHYGSNSVSKSYESKTDNRSSVLKSYDNKTASKQLSKSYDSKLDTLYGSNPVPNGALKSPGLHRLDPAPDYNDTYQVKPVTKVKPPIMPKPKLTPGGLTYRHLDPSECRSLNPTDWSGLSRATDSLYSGSKSLEAPYYYGSGSKSLDAASYPEKPQQSTNYNQKNQTDLKSIKNSPHFNKTSRGTPGSDRKSPHTGRKSPHSGRKSPHSGRKSPHLSRSSQPLEVYKSEGRWREDAFILSLSREEFTFEGQRTTEL